MALPLTSDLSMLLGLGLARLAAGPEALPSARSNCVGKMDSTYLYQTSATDLLA
jgi:hypothetical protein